MEPTEQEVEFNYKSDELSHHLLLFASIQNHSICLQYFICFLKIVICALNVIKFFEIIISSSLLVLSTKTKPSIE